MKHLLVLLHYSWRRYRVLLLVMMALLMLMQFFLVLIAGSLHTSGSFNQIAALIPPIFRQMLGPSFPSMLSFQGLVSLGYFHVIVLAVLTTWSITVGSEVAGEIETRFLDLILARPIGRTLLVLRDAIFLLLTVSILILMMLASTWAALKWLAPHDAPDVPFKLVASIGLNLGLLTLAWGGVSLAFSVAARRRGAVAGTVGLVAFACFILNFVSISWEPARSAGWISPFYYYRAIELVLGERLPTQALLVLTGFFIIGVMLAIIRFSRRDL